MKLLSILTKCRMQQLMQKMRVQSRWVCWIQCEGKYRKTNDTLWHLNTRIKVFSDNILMDSEEEIWENGGGQHECTY